jgi:Na+-transporting methylmalonyl-CoA/oxaloacetate decarboxylase gamma subunit
MSDLTTALIVTALGMGLVFAMIVMLWALMALLVFLTNARQPKQSIEDVATPGPESDRRRRAAVAAVAAALLREGISELHEFPMPPTALVSAWQAVMRSEMLKKRGQKR